MIENTTQQEICSIVGLQRDFFAKGETLDIATRLQALKALKAGILCTVERLSITCKSHQYRLS